MGFGPGSREESPLGAVSIWSPGSSEVLPFLSGLFLYFRPTSPSLGSLHCSVSRGLGHTHLPPAFRLSL